ncbi:MAG: hypothetical protein FWC36_01005 [Spirochaetes bacterium]|nr:hypothetical protein [Spirochaetota bacterium]
MTKPEALNVSDACRIDVAFKSNRAASSAALFRKAGNEAQCGTFTRRCKLNITNRTIRAESGMLQQ